MIANIECQYLIGCHSDVPIKICANFGHLFEMTMNIIRM